MAVHWMQHARAFMYTMFAPSAGVHSLSAALQALHRPAVHDGMSGRSRLGIQAST